MRYFQKNEGTRTTFTEYKNLFHTSLFLVIKFQVFEHFSLFHLGTRIDKRNRSSPIQPGINATKFSLAIASSDFPSLNMAEIKTYQLLILSESFNDCSKSAKT